MFIGFIFKTCLFVVLHAIAQIVVVHEVRLFRTFPQLSEGRSFESEMVGSRASRNILNHLQLPSFEVIIFYRVITILIQGNCEKAWCHLCLVSQLETTLKMKVSLSYSRPDTIIFVSNLSLKQGRTYVAELTEFTMVESIASPLHLPSGN